MTRRIVFASGKGGTGKTTMTALAALSAAADSSVVLADCDVEAANLPIALRATELEREAFAGGSKAFVDPVRCRGCGACQVVCRFDAIAPAADFYRSRTFVVDSLVCEGCGACVPACLDGAIAMQPGQAGEVVTADSLAGPMVFGHLFPGEDLSGKLVTEVRSGAAAIAAERDATYLLLDGPPGVGCPAIASITNTDLLVAVTEPTISGEHDLARLVTLARRLNVPVVIVLNKADLSVSGAARIRDRATSDGIEIVGEVPFDPDLAALLSKLAEGASAASLSGPGLDAARTAWGRIAAVAGALG